MVRAILNEESYSDLSLRQKQSGLSITKFCNQNKISLSKFYNLKRNFNCDSKQGDAHEEGEEPIAFAPIHIIVERDVALEQNITLEQGVIADHEIPPSDKIGSTSIPEITINLPSGVMINFRGIYESNMVSRVLTQICQSDVLSK